MLRARDDGEMEHWRIIVTTAQSGVGVWSPDWHVPPQSLKQLSQTKGPISA